jgi:multiple sugar transport system ATP-binding protein
MIFCIVNQLNCQVVNASGSRSPARLCANRTYFLMDEPLSNLDAKLRVSTRAQIKNLSHELAVTTIYVTHDQIEAMTLADRVVIMRAGVVQQVGTPVEIYDNPANAFVASFIGNPAMNLMDGSIKDGTFTTNNVQISGLESVDGPRDAWVPCRGC